MPSKFKTGDLIVHKSQFYICYSVVMNFLTSFLNKFRTPIVEEEIYLPSREELEASIHDIRLAIADCNPSDQSRLLLLEWNLDMDLYMLDWHYGTVTNLYR